MPTFNEGSFVVSLAFQPGISLEKSSSLGSTAEKLLLQIPGVASVSRRTGRAELDEHAEGVHSSEIDVALKPDVADREIIAREIANGWPCCPARSPSAPIGHRIDHLLSGVTAQIVVKIFAEDLDALRTTAETLQTRIARAPGIVDLRVERQVRVPQLDLNIDYDRAASYGVAPRRSPKRSRRCRTARSSVRSSTASSAITSCSGCPTRNARRQRLATC
ncbi:efflux RND transporter permease subunit [Hankyongella ginsenosidimutans]|uniref:efflux RND transporter permease subunit n=1 Tax=Hankyongella ginsenosidimutans TaxID=1763828 RepID=UPI003CCC7601